MFLYLLERSGKTSTFGQVTQFANFECQLKVYESLYCGRTCFIINVHVVKDWKISFITSKRTIPLLKNKNKIPYAKTTLLWPVFLSMANEVSHLWSYRLCYSRQHFYSFCGEVSLRNMEITTKNNKIYIPERNSWK